MKRGNKIPNNERLSRRENNADSVPPFRRLYMILVRDGMHAAVQNAHSVRRGGNETPVLPCGHGPNRPRDGQSV
jgi:hypothetical protein